jgi:hypothetical protein
MAGKHNAKTTDAHITSAPEQWVPVESVVEASGDGPAPYSEEALET